MAFAQIESNDNSASNQSSGKTVWGVVLLAIGSGILAAAQLGKVYIGLPSIQSSFSLSLVDASWMLSALSFVGLIIATPAGSFAAKLGTKKTVVAGLLIIAAASAAGGAASSATWLVITRVVEGLGFVMIIVAAPSLIVEVTERRHIRFVLAAWAGFMPAGIALATLLAPFVLSHYSWRAVWFIDAAILVVFALLLSVMRAQPLISSRRSSEFRPWQQLGAVLTAPGPVLLALIFGTYTFQHLGIMGLLASVLIENYGVSPDRAGLFVSTAMTANILGNLAAGVLLQRGVRRSTLIGSASLVMIVMAFGMFAAHLPLSGVYVCCFLFSCVGGIIPGTVLSAPPFYAPSTELIPATNGLLVQGSNLGIVFGPPIISALAAKAGWSWVPALVLVAASTATVLAFIVNRYASSRMEDGKLETSDVPLH
jgi:MFS family permease